MLYVLLFLKENEKLTETGGKKTGIHLGLYSHLVLWWCVPMVMKEWHDSDVHHCSLTKNCEH